MPRKSWIAETAATVATAPARVVKAIAAAVAPPRLTGDPWYRDDARKAAVQARTGPRRWLDKRPEWLRRRGR